MASETDSSAGKRLAEIVEPLRLKTYGKERVYFGLGDYQGARLLIHFPVYFSETPALIPVIERPVNATHVAEIKQYILERVQAGQDWILGSLTVNVNSNDIKLEPIGFNLYIVRIPNGTPLYVADGQHRISAIAQLLKTGYRACLSDEQIPLTLVVESNSLQVDTDFRDMAQTLTLSPALLLRFSSIPRDWIAQDLVEQVFLGSVLDLLFTTKSITRTRSDL